MDELFAALTPSEKEAWSQIESMVESPGFKIVKKDLEDLRDALAVNIFHVKGWEEYLYTKAQIDTLNLLINVEQRALQQLQQAVANRQVPEAQESTEDTQIAFV